MTKYMLHGGRVRPSPSQTIQYHGYLREILKDTGDSVRILFIFFAKPKEFWADLFVEYKQMFLAAVPEKTIIFTLADDLAILPSQIQESDVIYIRGGSTKLLISEMKKITDLKELWQDKVVAGSSAGANFLAKYYYSTDNNSIEDGLGILPIKVFPHFTDDKMKELEELKQYNETLPTYAIREGEYVVVHY